MAPEDKNPKDECRKKMQAMEKICISENVLMDSSFLLVLE